MFQKLLSYFRLSNWIVSRKTYDSDMAQLRSRMDRMRENHYKDLEDCKSRVDRIIQRASEVDFALDFHRRRYHLGIEIDARLLSMSRCSSDELKILAERIAHQVEGEIASSRFLD